MTLESDIIEEVQKHHGMKMSEKCVQALLEVLKKHCPHYNKTKCWDNCKCDPCTCNPCEC